MMQQQRQSACDGRWTIPAKFVNTVVLILSAGLTMMMTRPAQAQTRFFWPATIPDYARYDKLEQCYLATGRVRSVANWETGRSYRKDTLPRTGLQQIAANQEFPEVVAVATACLPNITTVPTAWLDRWFHFDLLLMAGRDQEATQLIDRLLTTMRDSADTVRLRAIFNFGFRLLEARPARFREAWRMIDSLDAYRQRSGRTDLKKLRWWMKLGGELIGEYKKTAETAWNADEERRLATYVVTLPDQLPDSLMTDAMYRTGFGRLVVQGRELLSNQEPFDSLARSTDAWIALKRRNFQKVGITIDPGSPEEEWYWWKSVPIVAQHWFPQKPSAARPTRGKVSLVWTVGGGWSHVDLAAVTAIRYWKKRWPELEITAIADTRGYIPPAAEPPDPRTEAMRIDSLLRQVFGLDIVVAVEETSFWSLTDPDRRKVRGASENATGWRAGTKAGQIASVFSTVNQFTLVDAAGIVINYDSWFSSMLENRIDVERMDRFIEAVMRQPRAKLSGLAQENGQ